MLPPQNEINPASTGLILNINKPLEWTSFDVVNRLKSHIRRNFPTYKNIKIGHAGTLDPLATGVLVVCLGKATKQIESLQNTIKEYTGTIFLGATTPSYDLETTVDQTFSIDHITENMIRQTACNFVGKQQQVPPVFSAKKINGVRAYEHAREGNMIKMKANEIEVFEMEITSIDMPTVSFRIKCSKGTYIRSIAHDFGQNLGSGAYLSGLCRSQSGSFRIEDSLNMENALQAITGFLGKI